MYRWYIRCCWSLSSPQHIVVFLTTFMIPVSFELVQGWQSTGFCLSCVNWGKLALYLIFYQIAMLLIAVVTRQDSAIMEERLSQMSSELTDCVSQLREGHQRQITGIEDRVGDLRNWVRDTRHAMRDELGVDLPPLTHSIRATLSGGGATGGLGLTVSSTSGWRARLLSWVKRQLRNARRWVHRLFVDWAER